MKHARTRRLGAANRQNCKVVSFTLPRAWEPVIAKALLSEDTDFSKFTRLAICDYLRSLGKDPGPVSR